jgi:hypothetical protein
MPFKIPSGIGAIPPWLLVVDTAEPGRTLTARAGDELQLPRQSLLAFRRAAPPERKPG